MQVIRFVPRPQCHREQAASAATRFQELSESYEVVCNALNAPPEVPKAVAQSPLRRFNPRLNLAITSPQEAFNFTGFTEALVNDVAVPLARDVALPVGKMLIGGLASMFGNAAK